MASFASPTVTVRFPSSTCPGTLKLIFPFLIEPVCGLLLRNCAKAVSGFQNERYSIEPFTSNGSPLATIRWLGNPSSRTRVCLEMSAPGSPQRRSELSPASGIIIHPATARIMSAIAMVALWRAGRGFIVCLKSSLRASSATCPIAAR